MNIIQITPGAGGMFCGGCFRDNALVIALRKLRHDVLMVPLYLPLTLEETDASAGMPIFFGGINVYLEQKIPLFRRAPSWLRRIFSRPGLLKWAAGSAAKTRPEDLGALTISMIRGEEGFQAAELEELAGWLRQHAQPDLIVLSNALLLGLARGLKRRLGTPVVCMLQGEDSFLDSLPSPYRDLVWETLAARATDVELFIAPSHYFGGLMGRRLQLSPDQFRVIYNGIPLDGFHPASQPPPSPTLGFFARMCREKGLDQLVQAFLILKRRATIPNLQLRAGGGLSPADAPFLESLQRELEAAGCGRDAAFFPNLDRAGKQNFLRSLTVFSVPAVYGEAFGLYILEAAASGLPLVQPRHAAFPELIEAIGGGVLADPGPEPLALEIEKLFLTPGLAASLGAAGRRAVVRDFSIETMAARLVEVYQEIVDLKAGRKSLGAKSPSLAG